MEPIGLAVGIAGLAGLFSTCIDAVERVDSYRDFKHDSHSLYVEFEAEKRRFEQWGSATGINKSTLSSAHHPALDNPQTLSTAKDLLSLIQNLYADTDDAAAQPFMPGKASTAKDEPSVAKHVQPSWGAPNSVRRKVIWSIRDKARRTAQVRQFGVLVQHLYNILPPDGAKGTYALDGALARVQGPGRLQVDSFQESASIPELRQIVAQLDEEMAAETRRNLRAWLGRHSPNDRYIESVQNRLSGTCDWILSRPVFQEWLSPDRERSGANVIWINGRAGYGKTMLCARVVEYLLETIDTPVGHFFLSSDFETRNDPYAAIQSWIDQVMTHDDVAFKLVRKVWLSQNESVAPRATIVRLFQDIVQAVPSCTFVLDGLDECAWMRGAQDGSDSVPGFLKTLIRVVTDTTARLMVVSRNESEIRDVIGDASVYLQLEISTDDVLSDTVRYSRSIVDRKLHKKDEAIKGDIAQRMAYRSNGQFLWLKLHEDSLRSWKNKKQLEDAIDKTSMGLEKAYERDWSRILRLSEGERHRAYSLLRWAAFALRPLTTSEIAEAVLIDDNDDAFPVEELPDTMDDDYIDTEILRPCGSLLEVQNATIESNAGSRIIRLAHFTVREYLLIRLPAQVAPLAANESLRASSIALQSTELARICLCFINYPQVWDGSLTERLGRAQQSFRDYAARSWYLHANVGDMNSSVLTILTQRLFDTQNPCWQGWRQWYDLNDDESKGIKKIEQISSSPLYYAAELNLIRMAKHLILNQHLDIDLQGRFGKTALYIACKNGKTDLVEILLNLEADVTVPNNDGWTPLNAASDSGHADIVKLLLEKGADVTVASNDGRTPLNAASDNGHVDVVKLLLEKGADVTVASNDGWTPLNAASDNGHVDVAKLLIEKGAEVTVANNDGWTPLHAASVRGHVDVVKLLLEKGADVTVANNNGLTPLNAASYSGHVDVVKLLLDKGADVTVAKKDGWTPLHAAAVKGHVEVAKLLLEKGADITVANNNGWTPLNAASDNGHVDVVKLLLEKGADVTVANDYNITPLSAAARKGHTITVAVLLANQYVEIDTQDSLGRTAIWWARRRGHSSIVQMLLGPDFRSVTSTYYYEVTVEANSQNRASSSRWRDICTFTIWKNGICYQCVYCHDGDFDICGECFDLGGRCLDSSHGLVLRSS